MIKFSYNLQSNSLLKSLIETQFQYFLIHTQIHIVQELLQIKILSKILRPYWVSKFDCFQVKAPKLHLQSKKIVCLSKLVISSSICLVRDLFNHAWDAKQYISLNTKLSWEAFLDYEWCFGELLFSNGTLLFVIRCFWFQ